MAIEDKNGCLHGDNGRFVPKGKTEYRQNTSYEEILSNDNGNKILNSGGKSGALDPNSEEAEEHAKLLYTMFRNIKTDVPKIAKVTGLKVEEIQKIKDYLFFNDEFDEDFEQAQSWDRLRHGIPEEVDFIFIKHEILELKYRNQGMDYKRAHELTEKVYNYKEAILERRNAINEKKRNN